MGPIRSGGCNRFADGICGGRDTKTRAVRRHNAAIDDRRVEMGDAGRDHAPRVERAAKKMPRGRLRHMQDSGKRDFRAGGVLNRHDHSGGRRDRTLPLASCQPALLADLQANPVTGIAGDGMDQVGIFLDQLVKQHWQTTAGAKRQGFPPAGAGRLDHNLGVLGKMRQHAQHAFRSHPAIGIGKIPFAGLPVGKAGADPFSVERRPSF